MKGVIIPAVLVCMSTVALAQTAVQQTGPVTSNSAVMWAADHKLRQAAGASGDVAGKMITGGLSAVGNVCSYTNTTDQSGISLCLDASGGRLVYNGTGYPISGGGGNVVGPGSTTLNHVAVWNNTSGTLLADATALSLTGITITPAAGLGKAISTSSTMSGTAPSGDSWYNLIQITSDNVVGPSRNLFGGGVYQICCGPLAEGYHFALGGRIDVNSAWSAADPEAVFVGVLGNARATVNAPSVGALISGGNFNVDVSNNATGWASILGTETDVIVRAGVAAPQTKTGHAIVLGALDAVNASGFSAAHHYINAGSSGGWSNLWSVDTTLGGNPIIQTTGKVLNFRGAMTVADVFDLTDLTVTGSIIAGPAGNMAIFGNGNIYTSRQLYGGGDIGASTYPVSTAGSGWARTANFSAANAEIIDWNTRDANVTGESFEWRQKSGASASNVLMQLNGRANVLATTVFKLRVNNTAGGENLTDVTLGAADSGGVGFRALRVAN